VQPLNAAVPSVLQTLLDRAPMSEEKLAFAWRVAVGPSLERATHPSLRDDGTVEVRVDHAAWRREVKRSHRLILSKLQGLLGESVVRSLKVVGGGR
jgi:predicted nucleic acid-binding Zn ribbon protein